MIGRTFIRVVTIISITLFTFANSAAQEIETLVMPGEVIADHADIEADCSSCHAMFDRSAQRQLCMNCHDDVANDINANRGFHGLHLEAAKDQCSTCHTEHEGRDEDIAFFDEEDFDHSLTDFEIFGAHQDAACSDCHAADKKYRDTSAICIDCHNDDSPHEETMGDDCRSCHNPTEWVDAEFDHSTTNYPLIGKHQEAACLDCHEDRTFQQEATDCFSCHAENDAHDGLSGQQCENCHNPTDWHDTSFNHFRDTQFPLEGRHSELTCSECHSDNPFEDEMDVACVSCHLENDNHEKHNGTECGMCHVSTVWNEPVFDHDNDTDYRLLGAHGETECNSCHIEPIFEVALETICNTCHADVEPHDGSLGTQCETCHTEINWQDPVFFDHDLTGFPLLGAHADNECEQCHTSQVFGKTENECMSCHIEKDPHRGNFQTQCQDCHNPVAWEAWSFDHDLQTDFLLEGAHVNVACEDCHRSTLQKIKAIDGNCRTCHRTDDLHDGEFGPDCGRCHTADTFAEVRSLQ